MATVLVTYATKHGSTAEVAGAVGKRLETHGARVEVRPVRGVRDLAGYDAVVLGGPQYMGRWHRGARGFLRRHRKALATLPLAVFTLGPLSNKAEDRAWVEKRFQGALARFPDLTPVATGVFGGALDPAKLRFPFSRMPAGDWRDWNAIEAWADEVAHALGLPALALEPAEPPAVNAPAF